MITFDSKKWVLKEGKTVRFFKTEQEAAKAAGLDKEWEIDHGIEEETQDNEESDTQKTSHYDWLKKED